MRSRLESARLGAELQQQEIRHYSRHLIIPEIGIEGQRRLKGARVLLIGAGGLGSPSGLYLAAAGVGTIGLVEFDVVDVSNLQRQVLYTTADVGQPKLDCAAARLKAMNPHIEVIRHDCRIDSANALSLIAQYDIVVDGTDNFPTRYLINDACVLLGKPNVYASVFRFEGLLSLFNHDGGPCYRCLYPVPPPPGFAPSCAEGGVFGVLPGIMGVLQAAETIKLITGVGRFMSGRLLQVDAGEMSFREFDVHHDPDCPLCGERRSQTGLIDYPSFCGIGAEPAEAADLPAPSVVSTDWLSQRITSGEPMQLIDVRSANEFQIVRIEGARLLPVDEIEENIASLRRDLPIVCYCKSGVRSMRAARLLLDQGFDDVASLDGGIQAWARDIDHAAAVY